MDGGAIEIGQQVEVESFKGFLVAEIGAFKPAVNFSPTCVVLLHTFEFDAKLIVVPAATVPETAATGAGVGAGRGVTTGAGLGAGLGIGFGVGRLIGATVTGVGAGAGAGTSCNLGCTTESRAAIARSRPSALSATTTALSGFFSPQAARLVSASTATLYIASVAF